MALDFSSFLGVHPTGRFLWEGETGNEVNFVLDGPLEGKPWGISCGKTCWKVCKRRVSNGWLEAVPRVSSWPSRIHSL